MSGELVTVFGGSGFLGRYVVRILCKNGYRVRVAVRNPHLAGEMRMAGDVGQVQIVQANVRNRPSIERALEGSWGVVNLVGILLEKGAQTFEGTQALGAKNLAEIASAKGVERFVQLSAIGSDPDSLSKYGRTKARAEASVKEFMPNATVLRPSVVFGVEDEFFNKFAEMCRFTPVLPAIGGGKTKFQPVFAGDVARAVLASLESEDAQGKVFELGGPETFTFKELLQYITKEIDRPRLLVPVPFAVMKITGNVIAGLMKFWPFHEAPVTGDQIQLMREDNVVSGEHGSFEALGITSLESVEAIVPTYLWRYREAGQFHTPRSA